MISQKQYDNYLDPANRLLLSSLLQPPSGTSFHSGLATTFTLDFRTAMSIPIHLAYVSDYGIEQSVAQQIPMLESIDRISDKLIIFTDKGKIHAPRSAASKLWPLLENNVIEVSAPRKGAFHPKIIVLRFVSKSAIKPNRIRLLMLSRNLTIDRSWDTVLSLDGEIERREIGSNEPIEKFIQTLPEWSKINLGDKKLSMVNEIANDIKRTNWEYPKNFDSEINFFVNGFYNDEDRKKYSWKLKNYDQLAIVSPFCTNGALKKLASLSTKRKPSIIGRSEELSCIDQKVLSEFGSVRVLEDMDENVEEEVDEFEENEKHALEKSYSKNLEEIHDTGLRGLHAKVYIAESNKKTHITLGSGNATNASLINQSNVEIFATLTGDSSKIGKIDDLIGFSGIGVLTSPFEKIDQEEQSNEDLDIKKRLEDAWTELFNISMKLICKKTNNTGKEENFWNIELQLNGKCHLPDISKLSIRLVSSEKVIQALQLIKEGQNIIFPKIGLIDLTRFLEFKLTDRESKKSMYFCTGLEIVGLPDNRNSAIYRHLIKDKNSLLKLLRLILSDPEDPALPPIVSDKNQSNAAIRNLEDDLPILEELIVSYCNDEQKIERIERFIKNIEPQEFGDSKEFLDEFKDLWNVFSRSKSKQNRKDKP